MLNDADVEAQIMVGELNDIQIEELNNQIASAKLPLLEKGEKSTLPSIMKNALENIQKKINPEKDEKKVSHIYQENEKIANTIYTHIPPKILKDSQVAFTQALHETSKSYRWVRYRTSNTTEWIETHPAYQKAKFWQLTSKSIEADSTNSDDLQKLSIVVWIENSHGKKYSVTEEWVRPTAHLNNSPISLTISSNTMLTIDENISIQEQIEKSQYFFVNINDKVTKGAKVFDMKGKVHDYSIMSSTSGQQINKAIDVFNTQLSFENTKTKKPVELQKVWVSFTIKKPHTKDTNIKRIIFDKDAIPKKSSIATTLLQTWDIDVAMTSPMMQFYQDKNFKSITQSIQGLTALQKVTENPQLDRKVLYDSSKFFVRNKSLSALTHIREQFNRYQMQPHEVSYMSEPSILAIRQGLKYKKNALISYKITDIISSNRYSFNTSNKSSIPNTLLSIKQGIWETLLESSTLVKSQRYKETTSAYSLLAKNTVFTTDISPTGKLLLYSSSKDKWKTWWDIDTLSGSTTGMIALEEGRAGGTTAEYLFVIGIAVAVTGWLIGSWDCSSNNGLSTGCCIGFNGAVATGGYVTGVIIGLWGGISAIVGFGLGGVIDTVNSQVFDASKFCPKAKPNEKWWERQLYES
jgi:hypothetical protein